MKRNTLFCITALLAGTLVTAHAGPKEDALAAAKQLAGKSYSWKTSVDSGAGGGGGGGPRGGFGRQEGKISAEGTAFVTTPGRDSDTIAVIKGDKFAVKRGEGWQSASELAANAEGGPGRFGAGMFRNFKAPAVRAQELIAQTKDLKSADGVISGDLTEEGAKSLMTFGGRGGGPDISGAKGSVKFWIKDGVLSKMETKVQGSISFNGNDREIDRTTTTEIKDVGATTVTVPEDASKKLQ